VESIVFKILSSDLEREKYDEDVVETDTMWRWRRGGAGGGGSYDEHKLATEGLYKGEYVPGN
jgi:hypothetical protein